MKQLGRFQLTPKVGGNSVIVFISCYCHVPCIFNKDLNHYLDRDNIIEDLKSSKVSSVRWIFVALLLLNYCFIYLSGIRLCHKVYKNIKRSFNQTTRILKCHSHV